MSVSVSSCAPEGALTVALEANLQALLALADEARETPGWPRERKRRLVTLWHGGHSFTEIGRSMGCSKNAAIGQGRRIGLPLREANGAEKIERGRLRALAKTRRRTEAEQRRARAREDKARVDAARPPRRERSRLPDDIKAALALEGTEPDLVRLDNRRCRWPVGDPLQPGFAYCGRCKPDDRTRPYCEAHEAAAVNPRALSPSRFERSLRKVLRAAA